MAVTLEKLNSLRAQLAIDRETCADNQTAQEMLDVAETKLGEVEESYARRNPLEVLSAVLDGVEIGSDTANSEELRAMVTEILEFEETAETVPAANRVGPLYELAGKCLQTMRRNYIRLYQKNRLADLLSTNPEDVTAKPE